ncbi:hypothetical protein MCOR25_010931 [Pyricularia grisea]|nr:hypothetical protein MCOR25_010931 [Pyricularia grisea]
MKSLFLTLGLLSLSALALADKCGDANYDPKSYICHNGNFLCPVVNGEGLSYCNGACYSKFMYQCNSGVLSQLPFLEQGSKFTLTAWNPALPQVHGKSIANSGRHWWVGGETVSYCPDVVKDQGGCPPGNVTSMVYSGGMNTVVPGGQGYYLNANWNVEITQAHSAYIPLGSTLGGLVAYKDGGFINTNGQPTGWVACPGTASGGGGSDGRWNLVARNASSADALSGCTGINLQVNYLGDSSTPASVWQYI